jgi:hypothetical protein
MPSREAQGINRGRPVLILANDNITDHADALGAVREKLGDVAMRGQGLFDGQVRDVDVLHLEDVQSVCMARLIEWVPDSLGTIARKY